MCADKKCNARARASENIHRWKVFHDCVQGMPWTTSKKQTDGIEFPIWYPSVSRPVPSPHCCRHLFVLTHLFRYNSRSNILSFRCEITSASKWLCFVRRSSTPNGSDTIKRLNECFSMTHFCRAEKSNRMCADDCQHIWMTISAFRT